MLPFFSFTHLHPLFFFNYLKSHFPPPFKDFGDLGFAMNPTTHIESQFPAQYFPSADWLHAFPIF
jgi:hypothetical protein